MLTHWMIELDRHPVHKAIAQCFEEAGRPIGTAIDSVACGIDRVTILFKHGATFNPAPIGRHSTMLRMILLDELKGQTFEMVFDVRANELGCRPQLMAHVRWMPEADED